MRKKTLQELMKERANQSTDTSAYTEKEMPKSTQQRYIMPQEQSTWNKIQERANQILNNTLNISSNFGLGVTKSAKDSLYYIENASNQNFPEYRRRMQHLGKVKEQEEQHKKMMSRNVGSQDNLLPTRDNFIQQEKYSENSNPILEIADRNSKAKSPILQRLESSINKDSQKIQENIDKSTGFGKKLAELMPSIGQSATGMVAGAINPALGISYFQTSAGGAYTQEAKAKGMNDKQAHLYGTIMGAMESATESIGNKLTTNVGKRVFKNGAKEGLKAYGLDIAENFFEEAIMEPIQESVAYAVGGKDKADFNNMFNRVIQSGIDGALTSILMGGASAGIGKATQLITKTQNGEQISQKEISDTLKEINKSEEVDIEKILVDSFNYKIQELYKIKENEQRTNQKLENIAENISQNEATRIKYSNLDEKRLSQIENSELNQNQIQKLLEISNKYDLGQKDIQDLIDGTKNGKYTENQPTTMQNKAVLNQEQQTIQEEGKQAQNQMSQETEGIEQKALNLRQSIDNYNNTRAEGQEIFDINNEETRKEIESIQKIAQDRNINIIFDENRFKNSNENAFYEYDKDNNVANIVLNPNSTSKKYVQNLVIHEMTHSFEGSKEYDSLSKAILDYAKKTGEYDKAFQDLKNTYSSVYKGDNIDSIVEKEAVANILGEKLGDKEFVDSLVNNQYVERSTIQKIIDFVKNQINRFKGYKDQEAYWNNVKTLFEEAYNKSEVSKEGLKASVERNNRIKDSNKSSFSLEEINSKINSDSDINKLTDDGITMTFVHMNNQNTQNYGSQYGQNIEPAGEYMSMDTLQGESKVPNAEYGIIHFDNPLILDHISTDSNGWKKTLSEMFGNKTGKSLSNAIKKAGYDAIMTIDENGNYSEIVNLDGNKNFNKQYSQDTTGAWNNFIEKYFKNEGTGTAIKDMKKIPEMSITKYQDILDNAKYIPQEEKTNLLKEVQNIKRNKSSLDEFKNLVNDMNNVYKEENTLNTKETYSTGRKEKYQKYLNSKTKYDNSALKNAMEIIPANNQGRRTKEQWLNVAKQIGTEIADKSNAEIEEIAFRTWQDERPSSKESLNRQGNKFVGFNSDEWINAIYDSVNEQRQYSVDTEQQAEQPVEQTVEEEKTVQEISKKINIKNEEIKNETKFNKLTKEQEQKIKAIKDDLERRKKYISLQADKQMARKKIKGLSMQASAEIRKIIQGDYLIPVEGGLTNIELKNRIEYLRSNYKGKKVIVNDKQGTIIGNAYGKVGVKFEDGTQKYLDKKFIKPVENIDEIINKQAQKNQTEQQAENQAEQQGNVERQAQQNQQPVEQTVEEEKTRKKILNPTEISNLKPEDANTTPELKDKKYKKGTKESNFAENIENDVGFLTEEQKKEILKDDNVKYYAPVTNADTLAKAYQDLKENGQNATLEWYSKDGKTSSAEDVAKGWILLKQYADKGDTQGMVNVAKKLRDMGTKAGQTVQAFNILSRLTPEGMVAYTQGELQDAYNEMVKGKTKKWINEHKGDFDLSQEEVAFIMDTMQNLPAENPDTNNYERKVALGQIQKLFTDKIPVEGGKIKAWMRISMLFNPKTQVRNVAGNVGIVPVNAVADFLGSKVDKAVAKKTGVRTLGNPNVKSYLKGAKQGLYQSYNDFRLGINTRGLEGSKFEFGEGKSFKDKGIGKALNRTENILNLVMDAGDRAFSQGSFTNSLNNQMVLNGVDTPTQEMIDIATQEALSRTWNDNNEYTNFVLGIRKGLNKIGTKNYGLGDVLIPFAKTPANLTKAIVDYSPVGLVNAIKEGNNLKNAIETGQFTPMQQHKFVDSLGKALAGTMLYVIGYGLAKAGIATGEADEDKDVKNFMKNSLGIGSYSIKIGNKSFAYDWAQPVATPIAIMTNLYQTNKNNSDATILEKALNAVNIGTNQIMEQSFMDSLNEVLNGNGEITERLQKAVLDLPARAIPTFSKQIADLVDSTQRTSFEYGKPLQSSINAVKAKIPFASKTLTPVVDTLGNEVKKYGGENNVFNVFLNPANMNKGQLSKAGKEIYNVYMQTGDTTVFPVTAPYYVNYKGDKLTMTAQERADYQRISGKYTEEVMNKLLNNSNYKSLNDEDKAEIISKVVNDSNSKAKKDVLNISNKDIDKIEKIGSNYYDYKLDTKKALDKKRQETGKTTTQLTDNEKISVLKNKNYSKKEKDLLYTNEIGDDDTVYTSMKLLNGNSLSFIDSYFDYKMGSKKSDDLKQFLNNNNQLTYMQKLYLTGVNNSSLNSTERQKLKNYIYSLNITEQQRKTMENKLKFTTEMKDGSYKWK